MNQEYYDNVTKLEQMGVNEEYMIGWQSGFIGNPEREEQRVSDAYSAGYEDGRNRTMDNADKFKS